MSVISSYVFNIGTEIKLGLQLQHSQKFHLAGGLQNQECLDFAGVPYLSFLVVGVPSKYWCWWVFSSSFDVKINHSTKNNVIRESALTTNTSNYITSLKHPTTKRL